MLPRWRAWLVRRLAPVYPMVRAEFPPIEVIITGPLEVAPGVALVNLHAVEGREGRQAMTTAVPQHWCNYCQRFIESAWCDSCQRWLDGLDAEPRGGDKK